MPENYTLRSLFETDGVFWIPELPKQKLSAHLSAGRNGLIFSRAATVEATEKFLTSTNPVPRILLGDTMLGRCTLLGFHESGTKQNLNLATGQVLSAPRFRVDACILGVHLADPSGPSLGSATYTYGGLQNWLPPNSTISFTDAGISISYPKKTLPLLNFCVLREKAEFTLKVASNLRHSPSGTHSGGSEPNIVIEPSDPRSLDWVFDTAVRLENFFSLLLGTSVRLRSVQIKTTGDESGWFIRRDRGKIEKPDPEARIKCDGSQLATAISIWLSTPEEFRPLEALVYGAIRNSSMFLETEFLSLAQALESFHRLTSDATLVESSTFQQICQRILLTIASVCVDPTLKQRLEQSIQFANEPSFRDRVVSLIHRIQTAHAEELLGNPVEFEQTLRQARNFFTHLGIRKGSRVPTEVKDLFPLVQKLHSFLRILMLLSLDFPEDVAFPAVMYQKRRWMIE